jgi:hypothetical protein
MWDEADFRRSFGPAKPVMNGVGRLLTYVTGPEGTETRWLTWNEAMLAVKCGPPGGVAFPCHEEETREKDAAEQEMESWRALS